MLAISSPTLVDRVVELERLRDVWLAVEAGQPRFVLLSGEAGIGKSRLLREFGIGVEARGGRILTGACMQLGEMPLAFLPVAEMVRRLWRSGDPAADAALEPARRELAALVPALAGGEPARAADGDRRAADLGQAAARARLFEAILGLFQRLAAERPLLVGIEDVHWSDPATRDLVTFLVHNLDVERLLVLATLRVDGVARSHPVMPWLAELLRGPAAERVDLPRLAEGDVGDQVAAITGTVPEAGSIRALWRRSDGNPFFVEELLAAGEDRARARPGPPEDRDGIPVSLVDVLLARVGTLPPEVERVVHAVAVAGTPVEEDLLEDALGVPAADLRSALRTPIEAGLLRVDEAGRVCPRHALLGEAIEASLLAGERRDLHEALARAFDDAAAAGGEAGASIAAARARHWLAADRPEEAFPAALDAADAASAVYAHAEASRHLLDALEIDRLRTTPLDPAARIALLMRAAEALDIAGDDDAGFRAATEALALVDEAADPATAGVIHGKLGYFRWLRGAGEEALAEHRRAVALVPSEPATPERAQVLAALGGALMAMGHYAESRDVSREAVRIAETAQAVVPECRARNVLGSDLVALGEVAAGLEELRESRRLAALGGTLDMLIVAHHNLALNLLLADHRDEAIHEALAGRDLARRLGLERRYAPYLAGVAADAMFRSGRWDEAAALADDSLAAVPGSRSVLYLVAVRARLHAGRGETNDAADRLEAAARLAGDDPDPDLAAYVALANSEAALLSGLPAEAVEAAGVGMQALEGSDDAGSEIPLLAVAAEATAELAADAVAGREADRARTLAADAATLAGRARELAAVSPTRSALALAARAEAEAARAAGEPAVDRWGAAVEAADDAGLVFSGAAARVRYAEAMLLSRSAREPAAMAIRSARDAAVWLGAVPLLDRVLELARRARVDLDRAPVEALAAEASRPRPASTLSERELEVLRLVAQGRSNGQIADELFITRKTASTHVTHILDKLGVSSRLEAAMTASRLGLLPPDEADDQA